LYDSSVFHEGENVEAKACIFYFDTVLYYTISSWYDMTNVACCMLQRWNMSSLSPFTFARNIFYCYGRHPATHTLFANKFLLALCLSVRCSPS